MALSKEALDKFCEIWDRETERPNSRNFFLRVKSGTRFTDFSKGEKVELLRGKWDVEIGDDETWDNLIAFYGDETIAIEPLEVNK